VQYSGDHFPDECGRWITSSFSLTLAIQLYCTGLIAFRIWSVNRKMKSIGQADLTPAIMIFVESGASCTFMTLLTLILYLVGSNVQFTSFNTTVPVVGLTFSLIIVRVSLGMSHNGDETTQTTTLRMQFNSPAAVQSNEASSYKTDPIAISVQKEVNHEQLEFKIGNNGYQDSQSAVHSSLDSEV